MKARPGPKGERNGRGRGTPSVTEPPKHGTHRDTLRWVPQTPRQGGARSELYSVCMWGRPDCSRLGVQEGPHFSICLLDSSKVAFSHPRIQANQVIWDRKGDGARFDPVAREWGTPHVSAPHPPGWKKAGRAGRLCYLGSLKCAPPHLCPVLGP